ncbi:hypothetical protein N7481_005835, partial [Penicillium waksmanii]|uniref:uncharacterized protein n=1 Tax=Penicillium waksmanii TaxID=69791 RepID=UPI00254730CF
MPFSEVFSGKDSGRLRGACPPPQKARQRKRLRAVDSVVDTLSAALARNGQSAKAVERWYAEMPREEEMLPKDKYTLFDKKEKSYRKGIHSMPNHFLRTYPCFLSWEIMLTDIPFLAELPKWTRVSQRVNPPWFLNSIFAIPRTRKNSSYSPAKRKYRHLYYTHQPRPGSVI